MTDINLSLICLLKLQQLPFQRKKNLRPLLNTNKITSNITGRFESIKGKNSSYQKFVLTTNLTTAESTDNYYNLVIKIYVSSDNNWNDFSQNLLVKIYKNN